MEGWGNLIVLFQPNDGAAYVSTVFAKPWGRCICILSKEKDHEELHRPEHIYLKSGALLFENAESRMTIDQERIYPVFCIAQKARIWAWRGLNTAQSRKLAISLKSDHLHVHPLACGLMQTDDRVDKHRKRRACAISAICLSLIGIGLPFCEASRPESGYGADCVLPISGSDLPLVYGDCRSVLLATCLPA